jgi:hypothetical protein
MKNHCLVAEKAREIERKSYKKTTPTTLGFKSFSPKIFDSKIFFFFLNSQLWVTLSDAK